MQNQNNLTRREFLLGMGATAAGIALSSCAISGDRSAKGLTEEALAVEPVVDARSLEKPDITVGYVPVNDCAPFAIAWKKGFFRKYGLNVKLSREASWATSRDGIVFGRLDASTVVSSHSGRPWTTAKYSFPISRRSNCREKCRAAAACFATSTRPLVSRSSRVKIDKRAPFAISYISSSSSPPSKVASTFPFAGCTASGAGLSTTIQSSDSSITRKSHTARTDRSSKEEVPSANAEISKGL